MKPTLPKEIQDILPDDIIRIINSFVPHLSKKKSPSLQHEIMKLQRSPIRGKNEMFLKGFDEFILD